MADPVIPDVTGAVEAREAATAEMWSWYLEWSQIARTVIKNRRLLRSLGFLRRTSTGDDRVMVEDEVVSDTTRVDLPVS